MLQVCERGVCYRCVWDRRCRTHRDVGVGRQPQADVGERGGGVEAQLIGRAVRVHHLVMRAQLLQQQKVGGA